MTLIVSSHFIYQVVTYYVVHQLENCLLFPKVLFEFFLDNLADPELVVEFWHHLGALLRLSFSL